MDANVERIVRHKFDSLRDILDERTSRLWAGAEAGALGRGGVSLVAKATGISRTTIYQGMKDLRHGSPKAIRVRKRIRSPGSGRKSIIQHDPVVRRDLERLVDPVTRGDPESPLRWTCKSVRQLSVALQSQGHVIGRQKVAHLLGNMGYSLQANQKTREGSSHPDRDKQFAYINDRVMDFQARAQPVVSVDTKKKELIGDFKNQGQEWQPKGRPEQVRVHDFIDKQAGKVNPYGVYDQTSNVGWVSVGTDNDTAEFAAESIRRWWHKMGKDRYPHAAELLVTADCGGSNGNRVRLWKVALQSLANDTGLGISVSHFPPGTSKWNKIEHRMFSHISMNWRGKPLISHEVAVNLIASTTTTRGLAVAAELDRNVYPKGVKISDAQLAKVSLKRASFHGEWNYTISPNCSS